MTNQEDEIVVFREFTDNIEASLAKSKLDAHGIPCFLTEENMAGLYPGQQLLAIPIRLHIFKRDIEEVSRVFMEMQGETEGDDLVCPRCGSPGIERAFPKEFSESLWRSFLALFVGILMPHKKVNHCRNCRHEF